VSARRALVTGASSGIGAATARLAAERGYRVALLARRAERLEELRSELPPVEAGPHVALACDLCDPEAVRSAFARCAEAFGGGLELLVNNAGVGYRACVAELDDTLLRRVIDTNVTGVFTSCREAHPLLTRGERPVVVNVSSVVGRRGVPTQAAYSATKAAICSLGEALRLEWAPEGIEVCTLDPGLTATGFFEAQPNPGGLPDPSLEGSQSAVEVARSVLALDVAPRPELFLRPKWRWLGVLSLLAPRLADKIVLRRIVGEPPKQVTPRRETR